MLDVVLHKISDEVIKSTGTRKALGQAVRFGSEATKDTYKEFFVPETELGLVNGHHRPFMLEHGKNSTFVKNVLGFCCYEKKDDGWEYELEFLDTVLGNKAAEEVQAGGYKTSTGSALHTIERVKVGDAYKLMSWYVTETSGTKTPADIYNKDLSALKDALSYDFGLMEAIKSDTSLLTLFSEQIKSLSDMLASLTSTKEPESQNTPFVLPEGLAEEITANVSKVNLR